MLTTIRKPSWPPGRPVSRCSTQIGPSTPWNDRLNTVEPIRMNRTKHDSFIVVSIACRSSFSRQAAPRRCAITSAPVAPIAPPSVGVATPRKIVPSTRKISASGGISTKVTRSAMRDSSSSLSSRLSTASANATPTPTHIDDDDQFVGRPSSPDASTAYAECGAPRDDHEQDDQRAQPGAAVVFADRARLARQRRRPARPPER